MTDNGSCYRSKAFGVGRRRRRGRELRSCNPARPSLSHRFSHLRTVRGQTPTACAMGSASARLQPVPRSTLDHAALAGHSCERSSGPPGLPRLRHLQLLPARADGQPMESSQLGRLAAPTGCPFHCGPAHRPRGHTGTEVSGTGVSVAALTGVGRQPGRSINHRGARRPSRYLPLPLELSHPAGRVSAV